MPAILLPLVLSIILTIADYLTEHVFHKDLRKNWFLISFSAGVGIAYILLHLFPQITEYSLREGNSLFFYALFGFVILHFIEKYYIYGSAKLNVGHHHNVHLIYFFTYNFLIGMALVHISSFGLFNALIFFMPFLLYIIVEMLPQRFRFKFLPSRILYSAAPLFGTIVGLSSSYFVSRIYGELIAFITGTLLYIVIRESIPTRNLGKPLYFILGVVFYVLVIIASWSL